METSLLKKTDNYRLSKCSWFCSKKDDFWELSNIASMPLVFDGMKFNSSEQLYQASKYGPNVECLPLSAKEGTDSNVRNRIFAAKAAMGSKMTQKCAVKAGLVRKDWDNEEEIRIHSMLWVLELKLWANRRTFGRVLKDTGDLPIVEKSRKDHFWGAIPNNGTLVGFNVLGKLLTILRDEKFDSILNNQFTYSDGFLLP